VALQIRNNEMVDILSTDFQRRNEPNFAWQNVLSMYSLLPGLRGFWPMSAVGAAGVAYDLSGNNRTLAYHGNPIYRVDGLAPYIDFDGVGDYLSRADEAGLDITGTEAYIGAPGLTLGGWWWFDAYGADRDMIGKWWGAADFSYLLYWDNAFGQWLFQISQNGGALACAMGSSVVGVTGQWYFIVGRFDNTDNTIDIWVNATHETAACAAVNIFSGAAPLEVGGAIAPLDGRASLVFLCASALPDYLTNALYGHTRWMYR